jgi:hypothetical protein
VNCIDLAILKLAGLQILARLELVRLPITRGCYVSLQQQNNLLSLKRAWGREC